MGVLPIESAQTGRRVHVGKRSNHSRQVWPSLSSRRSLLLSEASLSRRYYNVLDARISRAVPFSPAAAHKLVSKMKRRQFSPLCVRRRTRESCAASNREAYISVSGSAERTAYSLRGRCRVLVRCATWSLKVITGDVTRVHNWHIRLRVNLQLQSAGQTRAHTHWRVTQWRNAENIDCMYVVAPSENTFNTEAPNITRYKYLESVFFLYSVKEIAILQS